MTDSPRTPQRPLSGRRLDDALAGSEPLVGLMQRIRESRLRFDTIADLLPETLRQAVRPGPLDDSAWLLLASNAAAAAKLRQMLPALLARLQASGWQGPDIKVKIQPRT